MKYGKKIVLIFVLFINYSGSTHGAEQHKNQFEAYAEKVIASGRKVYSRCQDVWTVEGRKFYKMGNMGKGDCFFYSIATALSVLPEFQGSSIFHISRQLRTQLAEEVTQADIDLCFSQDDFDFAKFDDLHNGMCFRKDSKNWQDIYSSQKNFDGPKGSLDLAKTIIRHMSSLDEGLPPLKKGETFPSYVKVNLPKKDWVGLRFEGNQWAIRTLMRLYPQIRILLLKPESLNFTHMFFIASEAELRVFRPHTILVRWTGSHFDLLSEYISSSRIENPLIHNGFSYKVLFSEAELPLPVATAFGL